MVVKSSFIGHFIRIPAKLSSPNVLFPKVGSSIFVCLHLMFCECLSCLWERIEVNGSPFGDNLFDQSDKKSFSRVLF